jgi:phosphatidylglycerol:prolipoprotein diacylglycerol transferase
MYPTIGHLFSGLTGVSVYLPLPTFGCCMMLSFAGAWWAFRSEYKRKEAERIISPLPHSGPVPVNISSPSFTLIGYGLIGFIAGAKLFYWYANRRYYIGALPDFLLSFRGSPTGGIALGLATILAAWLFQRPKPAASAISTQPLTHPYQLMDRLLLYCGLAGFAGAIFFAKIEGITGLNYYGALIAGALTYLYINRKNGIPLAIAADIGSPGMMLAYGIGRIGCHLAGDGDWGIVNKMPQPAWLQWTPTWTWSCYYPHNSIHQGLFIHDCTDNYCTVLPDPVYPTSIYEAAICLGLFAILWALRRKLEPPGLLFAIYALLNGTERFMIEFIRVNPRYSIAGFTLTQAQMISLAWICAGCIALYYSLRPPGNTGPDPDHTRH